MDPTGSSPGSPGSPCHVEWIGVVGACNATVIRWSVDWQVSRAAHVRRWWCPTQQSSLFFIVTLTGGRNQPPKHTLITVITREDWPGNRWVAGIEWQFNFVCMSFDIILPRNDNAESDAYKVIHTPECTAQHTLSLYIDTRLPGKELSILIIIYLYYWGQIQRPGTEDTRADQSFAFTCT